MAKTIVVFAPHPDDVEFYAGGLMALYARDGAKIIIVTATDGRCGSYEYEGEELVRARTEEAESAAKIMGAEPPIWLGYQDFELDQEKPRVLREKLVRIIRQYKPDVVISEDPFAPDEPHPDHRALAWAASDAINYASLPLIYPEQLKEGLEIHYVTEKYYYAESSINVNKIIDISEVMQIKLEALTAHKSQMRFLVEDFIRQARVAGLDLASILGDTISDPNAAIGLAMMTSASEAGKKIGVEYGEPFRYSRFHPFIESILEASQTS
jgi:LmbE family N-acetylglucosaminyl deacetylase